jgi:hypothetical protein
MLALSALLSQPAPPAAPGLALDRPEWAFEVMSWVRDEPEFPFAPAWADFIDDERTGALMASVSPFADEDPAAPFAGDE